MTIGGDTHPLPAPFLVMATQNPIESEGTYPLPEAQLDRFLFKLVVDYPTSGGGRRRRPRDRRAAPLRERLGLADVSAIARRRSRVRGPRGDRRAVALADATAARPLRPHDLAALVEYGASPRGPIGLVQAAQALALLRGRGHAVAEDVADLARTCCGTGSSCRTTRSATACPPTTCWADPAPPSAASPPAEPEAVPARASRPAALPRARVRCVARWSRRSTAARAVALWVRVCSGSTAAHSGLGRRPRTRATSCPTRSGTTRAGSTPPQAPAPAPAARPRPRAGAGADDLLPRSTSRPRWRRHRGEARSDVAAGVAIVRPARRPAGPAALRCSPAARPPTTPAPAARRPPGAGRPAPRRRVGGGAGRRPEGEGLGPGLRRIGRLARGPGLVVVVSDFRRPRTWARPLRARWPPRPRRARRRADRPARGASCPTPGQLLPRRPRDGRAARGRQRGPCHRRRAFAGAERRPARRARKSRCAARPARHVERGGRRLAPRAREGLR